MNITILADKGSFLSIEKAAVSEKSIDWWDDNSSDRNICCECYAAVEIYEHLSLAGCSCNLRDRSDALNLTGRCNAVIYVGSCFVTNKSDIGKDGNFLSKLNNSMWEINIWGDFGFQCLMAAYHWLETLGFRWLLSDAKGNMIPAFIEFHEVELSINYDFHTRACYNEFIDDDNPGFLLWASRNRMNMLKVKKVFNPHYIKKLGLYIMGGGHEVFYNYLNPGTLSDTTKPVPVSKSGPVPKNLARPVPRKYYELHPEWFAMIDGKRSARDENERTDEGYYTGDNICTSNKDGVAQLAKNMIKAFAEGEYRYVEYLNLWAYDNGRWCQCKECSKIGNPSRRMLILAYDINKIFHKAYDEGVMKRRIKLIIPVYHETLEPPDKPLPDDFDYKYIIATFFPIERCYAHFINNPVCQESNSQLINNFIGWNKDNGSNYKGEIFVGEYYNVSSFASMPFQFTKSIMNDIPYYYETGTRHLYYMHISTRFWGMLSITNNLLAKLMRDRSANGGAYVEEIHKLLYPKTKETMIKFHKILEEASANSKYIKHYQFSKSGEKSSLNANITEKEKFPLDHCRFVENAQSSEAAISFIETMKLFKKAGVLVESALQIAKGIEKERIEDELMKFSYGYSILGFIFYYVQLRSAYDISDFDNVQKYFQKTETLRMELKKIKKPLEEMKYECPWYANAYEATWHSKSYEILRKELNSAINSTDRTV